MLKKDWEQILCGSFVAHFVDLLHGNSKSINLTNISLAFSF